jgi:tRNA (cytidine/uridine-2'-O-)-methyltransferase
MFVCQPERIKNSPMRLALYQPDMPSNTGTMMRLCACLGVAIDIIEPCGFVMDDRKLKRAGMDYIDQLEYRRHQSWQHFLPLVAGRLILLTTQGKTFHHQFSFQKDDVLLVGRESAGAPEIVRRAAASHVKIPMKTGFRSLNVAMAAAIVLSEALRQTEGFYDTIHCAPPAL